jgi:hypothetical protein
VGSHDLGFPQRKGALYHVAGCMLPLVATSLSSVRLITHDVGGGSFMQQRQIMAAAPVYPFVPEKLFSRGTVLESAQAAP